MKREMIIFLCSLILEFAIAPLRVVTITPEFSGFKLALFVGFVIYYFFTYLILWKYSNGNRPFVLFLLIMGGCLLVQLPIRILEFHSCLSSFPEFLFHILGIFLAYATFRMKAYIRCFFFLFGFMASIYMVMFGFNYWFNYVSNGNFTGKVIEHFNKTELVLFDREGKQINLNYKKERYLILNFWTTACGYCIQEIPEINKLFDSLSDQNDIMLYGICVDYNNDAEQAFKILGLKGAKYPNFMLKKNPDLLQQMKIKYYPTILIVDTRNNDIICRGNMEVVQLFVNKLLDK